jgi:hypothetical protein
MVQFEPPKIGTLANPRVKWPGRGVTGIWKATTNLIVDPELPSANWIIANMNPVAGEPSFTLALDMLLYKFTGDGSGIPSLTQYISSTPAAAGGTTKFVGNGVKAVQFLLYKGTADVVTFVLYDATAAANRLVGTVTFSTVTAACTTGTLYSSTWLGTDAVIVECLTTAVTAANDHLFQIYLPNNAATTMYASRMQIENSTYPTAYAPVDRVANTLSYRYPWAQIGALELWAKPAFPYNDANDHVIISDAETATCHISVFYKAADDKYHAVIYDGATTVDMASEALVSNAGLQVWTYFKVYWNNTTNSWGFYTYSSTIFDSAISGTALTTIPFSTYMELGGLHKYTTPAGWWDGWITDLLFYPTADTSDSHYVVDRPWFDTNEIANSERTVKISRHGIAIHNGPLVITDKYNRYIEISNSVGMFATDASGKKIHDIPNGLILTDMTYEGHLISRNSVAFIDTSGLDYSDTETSRLIQSAPINTELSNHLPSGMTNIKGAIVTAEIVMLIASAKVKDGIRAWGFLGNANKYNELSPTYNVFASSQMISTGASAFDLYSYLFYWSIIPVTWNAGAPYITWDITMNFEGMGAAGDDYYVHGGIYLLGFTV